jgi:hypothetical protein
MELKPQILNQAIFGSNIRRFFSKQYLKLFKILLSNCGCPAATVQHRHIYFRKKKVLEFI